MTAEDQAKETLDYIRGTYGRDLAINAPCAAAQGNASMNTESEEAGDGLD